MYISARQCQCPSVCVPPVCIRACVRVRGCACVRVFVCVGVRACVCVYVFSANSCSCGACRERELISAEDHCVTRPGLRGSEAGEVEGACSCTGKLLRWNQRGQERNLCSLCLMAIQHTHLHTHTHTPTHTSPHTHTPTHTVALVWPWSSLNPSGPGWTFKAVSAHAPRLTGNTHSKVMVGQVHNELYWAAPPPSPEGGLPAASVPEGYWLPDRLFF